MDSLISDLVETRRVLGELDRRLATAIMRLCPPQHEDLPPNCVDAQVEALLPPQPATVGDEV